MHVFPRRELERRVRDAIHLPQLRVRQLESVSHHSQRVGLAHHHLGAGGDGLADEPARRRTGRRGDAHGRMVASDVEDQLDPGFAADDEVDDRDVEGGPGGRLEGRGHAIGGVDAQARKTPNRASQRGDQSNIVVDD